MAQSHITSKDIAIRVKKGWDVVDFCNHYNLTVDEFNRAIDTFYSVKSANKEIRRELSKNAAKKAKKAPSRIPSAPVSTPVVAAATTVESPAPAVFTTVETMSAVPTLDELKNKEAELLAQENELKASYNAAISARDQSTARMESFKNKINDLILKLESVKTEVSAEIQKYAEISQNISDTSARLSDVRKELAETEEAIRQCKKVSIFVFPDGSIELENYTYSDSLSKVAEISQQYFSDEHFEELSVREIKQLAKLTALTQELQGAGLAFELIFDSSDMEELWSKLNLAQDD